MGLAASMFAGTSGMYVQGEKMGIIGNNIANVSTTGFKAAKMYFEDAFYQDQPTASGTGQVGRGVGIAGIFADFTQGAFETTGEATDLAIGGQGFFMCKRKEDQETFYTRAGNFRFDSDGYLTDPHGLVLQGWKVEKDKINGTTRNPGVHIVGTPVDIRLENFQSPPAETTNVTAITNLDSSKPSKASDATDPFFSLFKAWDATASTPLDETMYEYQTTMKVYDENGASHDLTAYFDQVDLTGAGGRKTWEYVVTCSPEEDGRTLAGGAVAGTSKAGVLMMGTLTFNSAGELTDQSAYTLKSGATTYTSLSDWTPADFSTGGLPICTGNFLKTAGASGTDETDVKPFEINFGLKNQDLSGTGWFHGGSAAALSGQAASGTTLDTLLPSFNNSELAALATTSFSTGSSTLFQSQDGYTSGTLQSISVDRDGILSGRYSNGQVLELYSVTLADFNNRWGLRREGGNLFAQTRESGPAITNQANHGGKGTISSNAIEQSNVDMANEFVQMIATQRGFQANSKIITTTDTLLGEVINLKR